MKFLKASFQNIIWWTGVIFVGIIFGVSLQFASAWVNPPATAPGASVGAPINTSNLLQRKLGTLITGGLATSVFKLYTGAGAGKVLTSDAEGLASWQESTTGVVTGGLTCGAVANGECVGCNGAWGATTCSSNRGRCSNGKLQVIHNDSYEQFHDEDTSNTVSYVVALCLK